MKDFLSKLIVHMYEINMKFKRYVACYKEVVVVCTYYFRKANFIVLKQDNLFSLMLGIYDHCAYFFQEIMQKLLLSETKGWFTFLAKWGWFDLWSVADYIFRFSVPHIRSSYESNFFKASLDHCYLSYRDNSLGYGASPPPPLHAAQTQEEVVGNYYWSYHSHSPINL